MLSYSLPLPYGPPVFSNSRAAPVAARCSLIFLGLMDTVLEMLFLLLGAGMAGQRLWTPLLGFLLEIPP